MVFWKSSALSIDPKKATAPPDSVTGSVGVACAGGTRLRGATPAAAAAPSPNPKNFLRDIACIFVPPEMGFLLQWEDTRTILQSQRWRNGVPKWRAEMAGCVPAVRKIRSRAGSKKKPRTPKGDGVPGRGLRLRLRFVAHAGRTCARRGVASLLSSVEGRKVGIRRFDLRRRSSS